MTVAVPAAIYVLSVILVSLLWRQPALLLACYLAVSILMLSRWHARSDLVFYGVAFVLGPMGEVAAVHFGAWRYAEPLYLIPIWLPFLWGIVALFLKKVSESLIGGA